MTFTPTNRPVPSDAPEDLYFNSGKLDEYVNSTDSTMVDRTGVERKTLAGIEEQFDALISDAAYTWIGDYAAGLVFLRRNQFTIRSGVMYAPAVSTPLPLTLSGTWATDQGKLVVFQDSSPLINGANFGMTGVGDDTAAFNSACTAAAAQGKSVWIPFPTVEISTASDAKGCMVYGGGVSVNGMIRNHRGLYGIKINGYRQDLIKQYPPELTTKRQIGLRRNNDTTYLIATCKPGRTTGFVVFQTIKDLTTSTNSLGGPGEFLRCGFVHNCTGVYMARVANADTITGTWTTLNVPASTMGHAADNVFQAYTGIQSASANAELVFNTTIPRDGKITVAILGNVSGPSAVDLKVDGVTQITVNPTTFVGAIKVFTLTGLPGTRAVSIKNASGSGTLAFVGLNFARLDETRPELSYDRMAIYRNATDPFYILNNGAHDYAIWDATANLYGGSYHGGETLISRELVVGGSSQTLVDGQILVTDDFYIQQRTNIDWSTAPTPGGRLETASVIEFRDGQSEIQVSFKAVGVNPSVIRHFHTGMNGVNDTFSELIFPRREAVGANTYLGQSSKVVLQNPTTKARAITDFTMHSDLESSQGGVFINQTAGSYNKIYYALLYDGRRTVENVSFTCRRTFN